MTKRRLENDLAETSDEVLADLSPDERLELALTANAKGEDEWVNRVSKTCPQYQYEPQPDLQYKNRTRTAFIMAHQLTYELHTTWLLFEFMYMKNIYTTFIGFSTDLEPKEVKSEHEMNSTVSPPKLLADLFIRYEGATLFANENLGVSLETWLALHGDGPRIAKIVADVLDKHENLLMLGQGDLYPNTETGDDKTKTEHSLDDLAEMWCQRLQNVWIAATDS